MMSKSKCLGYWFFGGFMVTLLYLLLWIDTRSEQVMLVAGNHLLIAAAAGAVTILYLMYRSVKRDKRQRKKLDYDPILTLFVSIVGAPLFIFTFAYTFCITANAFIPPQTEIMYKGHIVSKNMRDGKSGKSYYFLLDSIDGYGLQLNVEVSKREYFSHSVDGLFRRHLKRGGLGIDYRFRW